MSDNTLKVLVIGKVWPEPESSAAGSRIMQLIKFFQSERGEITFATAAANKEYSVNLSDLGIRSTEIKLNSSTFDEFVSEFNPDIVLFDRFMTEEQFGWRVTEQCPEAVRILDTEDLHCLRQARHQAWKEGREFTQSDLFSETAKREIASILRCDLSLMISEYEIKLLEEVFQVDESILLHLPFMLHRIEEKVIKYWLPYNKRNHFISIGNFLHEPNWNAVLYLKEEIWPFIKAEIPEAELHIYGAYSSQKVEQLHNPDQGFLVKGRAKNAKKVVGTSRVLLAPLRFGAGLKGKLIEAMECGTPSVTTSIGAESMHGNLPWPGFIENDPQLFAQRAVELYQDEEKWVEAQQNGVQIINQIYDKSVLSEQLKFKIEEITNNLETHRQHNFMGSILQHHTLASTRFMSKWIEEKNKS